MQRSPSSPSRSPWQTFWFTPRAATRQMLSDGRGDRWVWPLFVAAGVLAVLSPASLDWARRVWPSGSEVARQLALVAGGVLLGLLQGWLYPLTTHLAAGVLNRLMTRQPGQRRGTPGYFLRGTRLALAWSLLPSLLLTTLGTLLGPGLLIALAFPVLVWGLLLSVSALSEVQASSPLAALGALLLGAVLLSVLLAALALVAGLSLPLLGVSPEQLQGWLRALELAPRP